MTGRQASQPASQPMFYTSIILVMCFSLFLSLVPSSVARDRIGSGCYSESVYIHTRAEHTGCLISEANRVDTGLDCILRPCSPTLASPHHPGTSDGETIQCNATFFFSPPHSQHHHHHHHHHRTRNARAPKRRWAVDSQTVSD